MAERSPTNFAEQQYSKLVRYLLTRQALGIRDTGAPNDGLYYIADTEAGELIISDYMTSFSSNPFFASLAVEGRRAALLEDPPQSIIDVQLGEDVIVKHQSRALLLARPNTLDREKSFPQLLGLLGIDFGSSEVAMIDVRQGIVGEEHPIASMLRTLPDMPAAR